MYEANTTDESRAASARWLLVRRICLVTLCVLALSASAQSAGAQNYKDVCSKALSRGEAQKLKSKVSSAIKNPGGLGEAEEDVKQYFLRYYFAKFTCRDAESLGGLAKWRGDFFRQYINIAKSPDAQRKLTDLAFRATQAMAKDYYHPAVRHNATLLLGDLASKYATRNAPQVPLSTATEVLLDLLEKDSFKDRKGKSVPVHPSVKSAALVGLEKHALYGIDQRYDERLTKVLTEFIAKQERGEDVSEEVDHWMKCQALAALVQKFKSAPNAELQKILLASMGSEDFSLENRCYVASLMEKIDYSKAQDIDVSESLMALGKLSRDVMAEEAKLAKEYEEEMLEQGGGFTSRRGASFGRSTEDNGLKYGLRRLLSRLRAIERAGTSVAEAAQEETKAKIAELLETMKPIRVEAAAEDARELKIAGLVREIQPAIDRLVKGWSGGEPAAETDDLEEEFS